MKKLSLADIPQKVLASMFGSAAKESSEDSNAAIASAESASTKRKNWDVGQQDTMLAKLKAEVIDRQAFLNPMLSIYDVADMLSVNVKYLSRYLNKNMGCSFSSYITTQRVLYSAKLLLEQKQLSIDDVSKCSGFNSCGYFIRCFRDVFHQSPSVYRQTNGTGVETAKNSDLLPFALFSQKLRSHFPDLTAKEMELCYYIFQGIPTEDQSQLMNLTQGSLLVARCRIRDKMQLNRSDKLVIVLNDIVS